MYNYGGAWNSEWIDHTNEITYGVNELPPSGEFQHPKTVQCTVCSYNTFIYELCSDSNSDGVCDICKYSM